MIYFRSLVDTIKRFLQWKRHFHNWSRLPNPSACGWTLGSDLITQWFPEGGTRSGFTLINSITIMMSRNKDSSLFDSGSLSRLPTQSEFFNGFCMWNLLLVSSLKLKPSVKVGHSLKQNISYKLVSCGIFFSTQTSFIQSFSPVLMAGVVLNADLELVRFFIRDFRPGISQFWQTGKTQRHKEKLFCLRSSCVSFLTASD